MSLWALLAAPLLVGNDRQSMTEDTKSLLMNREVIAVDQDPLGREDTPASRSGSQEIWARHLGGEAVAVGLFNRGEQPAKMICRLSEVHVFPRDKARNLWAHADVQIKNVEIAATVPRHGVALFRIDSSGEHAQAGHCITRARPNIEEVPSLFADAQPCPFALLRSGRDRATREVTW